ncbi:MAG: aspartate--tRNA ligase [Planctomycetes bacterium]|nr:aspartate--tRNA ligase [Planctomycetota bacterium]
MLGSKYRTHNCGELVKGDVGKEVLLGGWVHRKRDHGGVLFIDMRDHYGITQVVLNPDCKCYAEFQHVRTESVILIQGKVISRADDAINSKMKTGDIEVVVEDAQIESVADVTPFMISSDEKVNEELRLKYRFLDLRRESLHNNLMMRSRVISFIRKHLSDKGFTEMQTPILTSSSPEGARDYLVPSRVHPGQFYALPQAPQQFKQLLMVSGFDKYFQIAPCFRDEDARADRSPGEFYQLDMEMSFIQQDDLFAQLEELFLEMTTALTDKKITQMPFPRITYKDAMNKYGSDKPDIRYGMELMEVADIFAKGSFKAFSSLNEKGKALKALVVKETAGEPRSFFDKAEAHAKENGAMGLGYIVFKETGPKGPIVKFLDDALIQELKERCAIEEGDTVFFGGGEWLKTCEIMGRMRTYFAEKKVEFDSKEMAFCWIVDFPMYEYNEDDKKIDFSHNPFSMPQGGMDALLNKDPLDILAYQYDIVCNGIELSSGAIRNHKPEVMYKAFEIVGYDQAFVDDKFGHMINAFKFGAPPHGGIAPGLDRIVMLYCDEPSIREVIAFPMNGKAQDLMMSAPGSVTPEQLKELSIKILDTEL